MAKKDGRKYFLGDFLTVCSFDKNCNCHEHNASITKKLIHHQQNYSTLVFFEWAFIVGIEWPLNGFLEALSGY